MSIASEIERLQTAKASLKTSIENKGVTVPEGATLDDYPALVDSISGGGGLNTNMKTAYNNNTSLFVKQYIEQGGTITFEPDFDSDNPYSADYYFQRMGSYS